MTEINLPSGKTAYEEINPSSSKTVICLHGGTIPSWSFDAVFQKLGQEGVRAIRYDMYGRGESSSPSGLYDRHFYHNQLNELITALKIPTIDTLVGSSFGGALSIYFASQQPDTVKKIALISPAINWQENNKLVRVLKTPILGKLFFNQFAKTKIRKRAFKYIHSLPDSFGFKYQNRLEKQFSLDNTNFWKTLFNQLTSDALLTYYPNCKELSDAQNDILIGVIWGTLDKEVSEKDMNHLKKCFSNIIYKPVVNRTHGLIAEEPTQVANFVFDIVNRQI